MDYEETLVRALLAERGYEASFEGEALEAEAIMTGGPALPPQTLRRMTRLKAVIRFASGPHDLSQEAAAACDAGIQYASISGSSAPSTAEHTIMLMLALLRRLRESNEVTLSGRWAQREVAALGVRDLSEVTVGLVGVGEVGRRVALLLKAFGTRVLYHKRQRLAEADEELLGVSWANMETLLAEADVISLHARSGDGPILGREQLDLLGEGACVINTGAGRHVDEDALFEHLQQGRLRAALDVFSAEPWSCPESIAGYQQVLLTPHVAGRSQRTARILFGRACAELDSALRRAAVDDPGAADGAPAVTPHEGGSALRLVLHRLAPLRALADSTALVARSLASDLPRLQGAMRALGCRSVTHFDDDLPRITLTGPAGDCELRVELPRAGCDIAASAVISSAASSALRFVIGRWLVDYAIWDRLLPKGARGSLPGRRLLLHGYTRQGQLLAWRAREIGLRVFVIESDARRRLEALHDGFETCPQDAPAGEGGLLIKTDELEADGLEAFGGDSAIRMSLEDEFTAWSAIALHVSRAKQRRSGRPPERAHVIQTADRLFLDALVSVRENQNDSDSAIWAADLG